MRLVPVTTLALTRWISTASAFLFFATMIPVYAQRDGQGDRQEKGGGQHQQAQPQGRPAQQQQPQRAQQPPQQQRVQQQPPQQQQQPQRAQQPQHQQQQQQPQRAQQPQYQQPQHQQQQAHGQQPQRSQQQAQAWQQQRGWQGGGAWQGRGSWQQNRARRWSSDHRTWAQRGGYGGYYIPQDRFGLYFGIGHFFRIGILPSMYLGYPRFSYGGFSFLLLDPYPEYWPDNWYNTDDVYIDYYDDGYYLYNRRDPSVRLAVSIAF